MNRLFILSLITALLLTNSIFGNSALNIDIPVYQGVVDIKKDGHSMSYAFASGDKVLVKISTEKDKEIRSAQLTSLNGEKVWSRNNTASFEEEISINREGVYTFTFEKKGLFSQTVTIDIFRKAGSVADHNPAWRKHNTYKPEVISFKVDSAIGYQSAAYNMVDFRLFNKYYYQNINLYNHKDQVKGNLALDGNHVQGFPMAINANQIPKDAKFKCYTYSLNSVLGGQQHWKIAELTSQIGGAAASIFLTPAAGFAIHGAMALVGPAPNKAPVMYYMSNRHSDIKTVGEIKSNLNAASKISNTVTGTIASGIGFISGAAGRKIENATKVNTKNEGDLDFTQKGNVTNLFVTSAIPPTEKYFIMTNSYLAHAKNIHLSATALYYFPTFFNVKAQEELYNLQTVQINKNETKYSKQTNYISIKD